MSVSSPPLPPPSARLTSLDAFRGAIMLYMASHGLGLTQVAQKLPEQPWTSLAWWFDHVTWSGGSTWDLIQPAFMFMVGVALPFSYARRRDQGDSFQRILGHALVRAAILVLLAVFLASRSGKGTVWEFPNVLAQIGFGYPFLLFVLNRRVGVQAAVAGGILAAYWLFFALHPLAPAGFDYAKVGVKAAEVTGGAVFDGFFGHWSKGTNAAAAFDGWLLNLFPRATPFVFNAGGYATLNFVPSFATMLFGLMAGECLRSERTAPAKLRALLLGALALVLLGLVAGSTICPIVKRIWTPSWALVSGGLVVGMLAGFYWVIDVLGYRHWAKFLVVVGMNSIAIYLMSQLMRPFLAETLRTHLGPDLFRGTFGPVVSACLTLFIFWLICWWMHRRKIFLRI